MIESIIKIPSLENWATWIIASSGIACSCWVQLFAECLASRQRKPELPLKGVGPPAPLGHACIGSKQSLGGASPSLRT